MLESFVLRLKGLGMPMALPHGAGISTSMPFDCSELTVVEVALPLEEAGSRGDLCVVEEEFGEFSQLKC